MEPTLHVTHERHIGCSMAHVIQKILKRMNCAVSIMANGITHQPNSRSEVRLHTAKETLPVVEFVTKLDLYFQ
ncbi:hypothetical protein ACPOL_2783 [Acidisarcina polymorpha]|uniref:Uncharacterized protein n=1 Tax=Acidisarcina polymorpha TaxID=2211140 RepID=A0A2Z5FZ00_9BACT|nr:hypothetical protein ACPOL_2783 [Acidisarcina polymorpha]